MTVGLVNRYMSDKIGNQKHPMESSMSTIKSTIKKNDINSFATD